MMQKTVEIVSWKSEPGKMIDMRPTRKKRRTISHSSHQKSSREYSL